MTPSQPSRLSIHEDEALFREAVLFTANQRGLNAALVEKDYYCSVLLEYFFQHEDTPLVLKGGTCLSKMYAAFHRLSEDLDFVIPTPFEAPRSVRRHRIEPVKHCLSTMAADLAAFELAAALKGYNNSKQYIAQVTYPSVVQAPAEAARIKIEVGLREELLLPSVQVPTRSIELGFASTNLYGAVIEGVSQWEDVYSTNRVQQGFLVLFTDGSDTQGSRTLQEAINARGGKKVYALGLGDEIDRSVLEEIGNAGFIPATNIGQLATKFADIQSEIALAANSFYWLHYMSPKRGDKDHTLKLIIKGNKEDSYITGGFNSAEFFSFRIPEIEFVWIEPGTFLMGAADLGFTEHEVTISRGFYLGKYEITQGQWESVMGSNPSYFGGSNRPVEQVSWNDVQEFIGRLNEAAGEEVYRLPTEAEWEYACRAGTTTRWSFGDDEGQLGEYAWYTGNNSPYGTKEVGTKRPNPWGLYDMHGNVWEWCQDWYGSYTSDSQIDPAGPAAVGESLLLLVW